MKDQMTGGELKFCLDPENDRAKLKNFYRIWVRLKTLFDVPNSTFTYLLFSLLTNICIFLL